MQFVDIKTEDLKEILSRKTYGFIDEQLNKKKDCLLDSYMYFRVLLVNEKNLKDALEEAKDIIRKNNNHFPVFLFENNMIESRTYSVLSSSGSLFFTTAATVIECAVRTFIQLLTKYNEGIQNAFRVYTSIKKAIIQLYFFIYFYLLRKYMYITLTRENEKQLIKIIVIYIAYALLGLSTKSEIEDFIDKLESETLNIDKKYIKKSIERAIEIMKSNPTKAFPELFNEFVEVEPKPNVQLFISTFVRAFGGDLAKVCIPNLTDVLNDGDVALTYFITAWYNFLFTNMLMNQKTVTLLKRLSGDSVKEVERSFSDIVFRGHFGKC